MKRLLILLFSGLLLTNCATIGFRKSAPDLEHFVRVENTKFMIGEKLYYFVGTNVWYGANLGSLGADGDRERLIRELDQLKSLGITNLRVLGASEGPGQHNSVRPQFQPDSAQYNEMLFVGLDFLLHEMRKRDMYAVIYLNNFWVWSGGMSQYMAWVKNTEVPNPFKPEYTWSEFMDFSATFYQSEPAQHIFRDYLKKIINRKNSISGMLYKHDPTIMAWQLANEPRPGQFEHSKQQMKAYLGWIDSTAAFIKSLDPNHLVSTGSEGFMGCNGDEDCVIKSHESPNVDYMTFHLWIKNWGWFNARQIEQTYESAENRAVDYFSKHMKYAEQVGKPITIEEFGIPRDEESYKIGSPTTARDRYFKRLFELIAENAAAGAPIAGSNFWAWGGEGKPTVRETPDWREGDDYTGDPPQEPQGLNAVFSSDTSTLELIKAHADQLKQLVH